MQNLAATWSRLSSNRKLAVIAATALVFLAVLGLTRLATAPRMVLLYAGLEASAANEVIGALEQRQIDFDLRGDALYVPADERDTLRLSLAAEGLPHASGQGYELLDGLSGFGTTSQMFDAAYWRAKEGELARTILSSPFISAARVHIAAASANPFQQDRSPSASVSVSGSGGAIDPEKAKALRYLVASAVPGLLPSAVSVIDSEAGLIGGDDTQRPQMVAEDIAGRLRDRAQRLIEARMGVGNAVVEVSVDTVSESELIRERRVDPETRVVISSDTEERTGQSENQGPGNVTVASNLPDGGANGENTSSSQENETRERLNFEVSETTREITREPGDIKRLSVAVLVNEAANGADAQEAETISGAELEALRELVASAVGFDEARGDTITIRAMPFDQAAGLGTAAIVPGLLSQLHFDAMTLIQIAVLALVALGLGLFVLRPILTAAPAAALPAPGRAGEDALTADLRPVSGPEALTGEVDDGQGFRPLSASSDSSGVEEDPVERLRGLIGDRREETVEVLRNWLDAPEEVR